MALKLSNNASSTLASSIDASVLSLSVQLADASLYPVLGAGDWFPLTVTDASGNVEIMRCTARTGAMLTVARAQEGTTARAFAAGSRANLQMTVAAMAALETPDAIAGATAKVSPVDVDTFGYRNSSGGGFVALTWANAKAALWSAWGGLIAAGTSKATPVDGDSLALADSADANSTKKLTWANAKAALLDYFTLEIFAKADTAAVAFTKTGAGTVSIKAGTTVEVANKLYTFASATAVTMPTLAVGDYAIWIRPDGILEATTDFTVGPVPFSRKIGGFHYAPGGNAAAMAGGNTTPQINEHSFWDIKFRPACADPRGMALVAGSFWVDIYLLGVNHHTDGTSRYNVTIADGSSPPKVPTAFGGNGSTTYSTLTWFEAAEVMQSHGKELLSYAQFAAAAYGTTEASSGGTDPVSTILRAAYTSKWGVMLATGNLWVWGKEFGGSYGAASYVSQGRGSAYLLSNAALFGGSWDSAADSGSRASDWSGLPSNSSAGIGARGCCDHLTHV